MLKDAATLSWPGLVKKVLPSKDSCWLASANGVVSSSSLGKGRAYRLLSCPDSAAAVAAVEQLGAPLAAEQGRSLCSLQQKDQFGSPLQQQ